MPRAYRLRTPLWIATGTLGGLAVTVAVLILGFEPYARNRVVAALHQRYKSDVELGEFRITLLPAVRASGENLLLRLESHPGAAPMVTIRHFALETSFIDFFRNPRRIHKLTLDGLEIHIPPTAERPGSTPGQTKLPFVLDNVEADNAILETLPSNPKKDPLRFAIPQLTMHAANRKGSMHFHGAIENPKPPGLITSDGDFGPWNEDDPGSTAVAGTYVFRNADLAVFKGISGTLSSTGNYRGALDRIEVRGKTTTPDFSLSLADHPLPLQTEFDATVDGLNGDTELHSVRAMLGKSEFEVSGTIDRSALEKHKQIALTAVADNTALDGFLHVAAKGPRPPMTGTVSFNSKVTIPPGETPVIQRLLLGGHFRLSNVAFTSADVERRIASLSHRALGNPKDKSAAGVHAQIGGDFQLRSAILYLPRLQFEIPGADVTLAGTYGVKSGDIDLTGTAMLHATLSQMTTGIKHILLKPVDRLFEKNGAGTALPIRITGTRGSPSFKLDFGRVL